MVSEDYLHRIGRTGRAGVEGEAISLVCVDEAPLLRSIENLLRRPIRVEVVEGFEPDRAIRPEPIRLRFGRAPGDGGAAPWKRGSSSGAARAGANQSIGGRIDPSRRHESPARQPARRGELAVAVGGRPWNPGWPVERRHEPARRGPERLRVAALPGERLRRNEPAAPEPRPRRGT